MAIILDTVTKDQPKTILLRLRQETYDQCRAIADQAQRPLAAVVRQILEGALAQGVRVVTK